MRMIKRKISGRTIEIEKEEPWFFEKLEECCVTKDDLEVIDIEKLKKTFNLNEQDEDGNTFIHYIVINAPKYNGGYYAIECFIKAGSMTNIKNNEGLTPIECFQRLKSQDKKFRLSEYVDCFEKALLGEENVERFYKRRFYVRSLFCFATECIAQFVPKAKEICDKVFQSNIIRFDIEDIDGRKAIKIFGPPIVTNENDFLEYGNRISEEMNSCSWGDEGVYCFEEIKLPEEPVGHDWVKLNLNKLRA